MVDNNKLKVYLEHKNVDSIFKILPLYEESNLNLDAYLSSLLIELNGLERYIDNEHAEFVSLISTLTGIQIEVTKKDNHKVVKREVFKAIDLSTELSKRVVK